MGETSSGAYRISKHLFGFAARKTRETSEAAALSGTFGAVEVGFGASDGLDFGDALGVVPGVSIGHGLWKSGQACFNPKPAKATSR